MQNGFLVDHWRLNHSKSKDPKIREWAREWAREGGHTSERARTTVWTRAEVDLPAEVPAFTVECYSATARTDGQDDGPAVEAHTASHTSRPQDRSLQSSSAGSRGSTQHVSSPRTPSAPPPLRGLALGNGQLHLSNILSHPPAHPDYPPSISGIDSHHVQMVPPPPPSSSEEAVGYIPAGASLNETLPETTSDKTQSTQTPDPEQSPRPESLGHSRLTPQLLDWGSEVGRIREMMSQLEERKTRKTTIFKEAQELQQKKEEAVAVAVQLEADVQEARKRMNAASQEAEEFENEVKKRTAMLLGSGKQMQKKIGALAYLECSALTGEGVKEVFDEAAIYAMSVKEGGGKKSRILLGLPKPKFRAAKSSWSLQQS
ncbi:GTP-binding protein Rho1 [Elasticomyces elasticus]|nr:GTP-binding protein Rho1 [Elasticomyces elasticus]